MKKCIVLSIIALTACFLSGCSTNPSNADYQTIRAAPNRNTELAKQENTLGTERFADGEMDQAEAHFRRAINADLTFGPAHNNLGKVYYHTKRYYEAAWEFEYAAKLMPHRPEPRSNLGLVYEAIGRLDDAVTQYTTALDLAPDHPHFIGNLARAKSRRGDNDQALHDLLNDLVLKDTRPEWVQWARVQLHVKQRVPTANE